MDKQPRPMPAWMEQQLELVRRFQVRFNVPNPMVDFDVMPQEVWLSQMNEALTTGRIPTRLQRSMGFTTSVGDASNPDGMNYDPSRQTPESSDSWPKMADYPQTEAGWNRYANAWVNRRRRAAGMWQVPMEAVQEHRAAMGLGRSKGWSESEGE